METQLTADLLNICVTRVLRRMPLVEQELTTFPEHLCSPEIFSLVRVTRSIILCAMLCRSLFVLLYFFFWPMCFLSFDLLILITPLVSANSSYLVLLLITRYKTKLSEPMHLSFDILFYSRLKLCSIITWKWTYDTMTLQWRLCRKDDIFISLSIRSVDDVWIYLQYLQTFLDSTTGIIFSHSIKMEITITR